MEMKNGLFLILLASLCCISASCLFSTLNAVAFKPTPTIDLLPSSEVPVCGKGGNGLQFLSATGPLLNDSGAEAELEPEPEQQPWAMNILCNLEVNSAAWEIEFVAQDDDPDSELTASILSGPSNGQLSEIDQLAGNVTYTPNLDFVGQDQFTYSVNDGTVDSNVATVTVHVIPPPGWTGGVKTRRI